MPNKIKGKINEWCLPETFVIGFLTWEDSPNLKDVTIECPDYFEILEIFNLENEIKPKKKTKIEAENIVSEYLGFKAICTKKPKEASTEQIFKICFNEKTGKIDHILKTVVLRPLLVPKFGFDKKKNTISMVLENQGEIPSLK